jgi:hypothetical protein
MRYYFNSLLISASVAMSIFFHVKIGIHYMVLATYWILLIIYLWRKGEGNDSKNKT